MYMVAPAPRMGTSGTSGVLNGRSSSGERTRSTHTPIHTVAKAASVPPETSSPNRPSGKKPAMMMAMIPTIHVDAAGVWYEVAFDGFTGETEGDTGAPADTDPPLDTAAPPEEDPTLCDGCGTLTHQGVALGEVCLDFSALVAWDGTTGPW